MSTLQEELKAISGRKKRFLLLRILDKSAEVSRQLTGITKGTYNSWLQNPTFVALYRRREEFKAEFKQEALQMMRRSNQLSAILLEEEVIVRMQEEITSGVYVLIKTQLAKEVYSKLINDLDYQPPIRNLTWQDRVAYLMGNPPPEIGGGTTDGEFHEADSQQESEPSESPVLSEGEPTSDKDAEETAKTEAVLT